TLARAIDRKICRTRGCCVSAIEEAGTDRKGRALVVATIDAGDRGVASCLVPQPVEPEPFGSGALDKEKSPLTAQPDTPDDGAKEDEGEGEASGDGQDEDEGGAHGDDCHPYEYHLIAHTKGKIRARHLLSEACNNGYGFAGVGEDEISVDAATKTFTHKQSGGSNWRWDTTTTFGLDPFRTVSEGHSSLWILDEDGTSTSWELSYDTFEGKESWSAPDCEGRRKQAEAAKKLDGGAGLDESAASLSYEAVAIPRVELPAAFVKDGWRTTALGNCGAPVDGDTHGFAVYGGKGHAADAAMRVVVSKDGVLFVEIADDRWTREGKSWVKEDHIELWLAEPGGAGHPDRCYDDLPNAPPPEKPEPDPSRQWGIRISDGQVFPGFGSPEPLAGVEVVRSGSAARARIPVGDWLKTEDQQNAITVVYSDSDDGVRQKRLIATSQLDRRRGKEFSLGSVRTVDPAEATCVVKGRALRINRPAPATKRDKAAAAP
ncbi:MAG TPA: hypothetical protein VNR90_11735, partial [Vicinamibacterales bacterium]|nr:hypothetical protein [Vicinamibacterales bacterium]